MFVDEGSELRGAFAMTRVAVIGNAGGGKSTMARRLGAARGLPYHALDLIQWNPGWRPVAQDEYDRRHDAIVAGERWIVDGFGDMASIDRRIEAADTIVFVDHPLPVHLWWATKRQVRSLIAGRPDGPPGCTMWRKTVPLYRMIWSIHRTLRPQLLARFEAASRVGKTIHHLRSPRDLAAFERQYARAA